MSQENKSPEFIKIVYFDEVSAQDYLDITNGGHLDWNEEKNKQRVAEILAEIEAKAKGGFNVLNLLKASLSGTAKASVPRCPGANNRCVDRRRKSSVLDADRRRKIADLSNRRFGDRKSSACDFSASGPHESTE